MNTESPSSSRGAGALSTLPAACAAGLSVGLVDALQAVSAGLDTLTCLALIEVSLFSAALLALLVHAAAALVGALHTRVPRVPRALVEAPLVALLAWPLARELFSGAGVRHSTLGTLGPWLVPALCAAFVPWALSTLRRLLTGSRDGQRVVMGLAFAAAACALVLDRTLLVGLYPYLHVLAVLCALLGLGLLWHLLLPARALRPELGAACVALVALPFAALVQLFPHDNAARVFLADQRPFAQRLMLGLTHLVDFDRDDSSLFFVGGDCDDFNPSIGPHAADIPGDGIDQDCDGHDMAVAAGSRHPYGGSRAAASRIANAAKGRPTVVVLIDALRADRLGRADFPTLARLQSESVVFENAYTPASSTARAVPAMLTGHALPKPEDLSALEKLRARGVSTAMVSVDVIADTVTGRVPTPGSLSYPMLRSFERTELVPTARRNNTWGEGVTQSTDAQVTDAAFRMLDGSRPPQLLWVHYYDLHQWMMLDGVSEQGRARYDAVLRRTDAVLARWLARIDSINLVLLSDHGEALGDHGIEVHTTYLWSSLVRVPLLIRVPTVPAARVVAPVSVVDLAPTLLDLFGQALREDQGFSLLGLVGVTDPVSSHFGAFEVGHIALLAGRHRLILDLKTRASWLHDVIDDPTERRSIASEHPDLVATMVHEVVAMHSAAQQPRSQ